MCRRIILVFVLFSLLFSAAAAEAETEPQSQKNIVFISIDDLNMRVGYTGASSQVVTPNIDSLAAESVRFHNASADAPWCNPSRVSFALSLRPSSTGVLSNLPEQREWRTLFATPESTAQQNYGPDIANIRTIYGHFRDQGYYVSGMGKVLHSSAQQTEELETFNGFDEFRSIFHSIPIYPENAPLSGLQTLYDVVGGAVDWGAIEDISVNGETGIFTEEDVWDYKVGETAVTALSEMPTDQPFFLSVGFRLPHAPHYVPQRFIDLYTESALGEPLEFPEVIENDRADTLFPGAGGLWQTDVFDNQDNYEFYMQSYLASISMIDEQVGKILAEIDRLDLEDDTIVVLWSDHGYHNGEKQRNGKPSYWVEGIQVPMLFRVPGATPKDVNQPVNSIDIMPTLVDLNGLNMPSDIPRDGRSFTRLINEANPNWGWDGFAQFRRYGSIDNGLEMAVYNQEWWYAEIDVEDAEMGDEFAELYDMVNDPKQWVNLLHESAPENLSAESTASTFSTRAEGLALPNAAPTTADQTVNVDDVPQLVNLIATDINVDHIEFKVVDFPDEGRLFQANPDQTVGTQITSQAPFINNETSATANLYYLSDSRSATNDTFTYEVSDGIDTASGEVTIEMVVASVVLLEMMPFDHLQGQAGIVGGFLALFVLTIYFARNQKAMRARLMQSEAETHPQNKE